MVALLLASMATHLPTVRAQPTDDQPEGEEAPQDLQHAPGVFEGHTLLALVCDGDQARAYPLPNGCAGVEEEGSKGTLYTAGELSGGILLKKKAFLVQEDSHRDIQLHSGSKRVSTTSSHCGFKS